MCFSNAILTKFVNVLEKNSRSFISNIEKKNPLIVDSIIWIFVMSYNSLDNKDTKEISLKSRS